MKPLLIILCYKRWGHTQACLTSLIDTVDVNDLDVHVVDNGSQDGTARRLLQFDWLTVHKLPSNIGVPRALNFVLLRHRKPGQHVIKMDNDAACLTDDWLKTWLDFLEHFEKPVALITAWRPAFEGNVESRRKIGAHETVFLDQFAGHFALHTGAFMDRVGYFDVLAPNHLYGYEDIIMCEKARVLKWAQVAILSVRQSHPDETGSALPPAEKKRQVSSMHRHFRERVQRIKRTCRVYTASNGLPSRAGGS